MEAGNFANSSAGRTGRFTNSPPQLGHSPPSKRSATQSAQKVHSKLQIIASSDSGGRSRSQHSQFGLSASMARAHYESMGLEVCVGRTLALAGCPKCLKPWLPVIIRVTVHA